MGLLSPQALSSVQARVAAVRTVIPPRAPSQAGGNLQSALVKHSPIQRPISNPNIEGSFNSCLAHALQRGPGPCCPKSPAIARFSATCARTTLIRSPSNVSETSETFDGRRLVDLH